MPLERVTMASRLQNCPVSGSGSGAQMCEGACPSGCPKYHCGRSPRSPRVSMGPSQGV